MVRWFTAANTKLWWSWIYVHYQSHKHFEFTKDYCLHSSHSLITDKLANGIYASLPFYGSWENHFSKVNRRGENSKWSFKGAHYTDLDSITFYSQALEIPCKMVRWRLWNCFRFWQSSTIFLIIKCFENTICLRIHLLEICRKF